MRERRITVRGWKALLLLAVALTLPYLLATPRSVSPEEATRLIRHYLKYQVSQSFGERYRAGAADAAAGRRYQEELARIDRLQFEAVSTGRLLPDYFLSVKPNFYARAVIRDETGREATRYFYLSRGVIVTGESSPWAWHFVF